MKLLILFSATLAAVSATSDPFVGAPPTEEICFTKAGRLPGAECVFPFEYKGEYYFQCTTVDSVNGEAWCGTRDTVRLTSRGKVVAGDVGDCDFQSNSGCGVEDSPEFCDTAQDCYSNGYMCDPTPPPGSSGCVCKNNICKLSSGCGTAGLNWFNKCSSCSVEGCEDEGVCSFRRGRCTGPEDYPNPPTPDPYVPSGSCRTKSRGACIFPFSYKNQLYYKCTYADSPDEPWCAVVPTVSVNSQGVISDFTEVDDCFIAPGSSCEVEEDNSCTYDYDCSAPGKLCETVADVSCICKKGECKYSSGCGTNGAFFFKSCSDCDTDLDGCEDEGACRISGSRSGLKSCVSK